MAVTADAPPSQVVIPPPIMEVLPDLIIRQPTTGSRFGFGIFGTATFGGTVGIDTLSLTAATTPGGLILTGD